MKRDAERTNWLKQDAPKIGLISGAFLLFSPFETEQFRKPRQCWLSRPYAFETRMVKERAAVFDIVRSLAKATVGVVVELPVSVVADAVTLGGQLSDKGRSYTADAVKRVAENIEAATKKDGK